MVLDPISQRALEVGAKAVGGKAATAAVETKTFARLAAFVTGGPPLLVYGPSGVGKSALIAYLGGKEITESPSRTIDVEAPSRTRINGRRVRTIDTPGQVGLRPELTRAFFDGAQSIEIVMFVASNGLLVPTPKHSGTSATLNPDGPFLEDDYLDPNGQLLPTYQEACWQSERSMFLASQPLLHQLRKLRKTFVVVNKAELWWTTREATLDRYRTGDWGDLLDGTPGYPRVLAISSVDWQLLPNRNGFPPPTRNYPSSRLMHGQDRLHLREQLTRAIAG